MEKLDEIWMSGIYKAVGATSTQHSYGPSKTNMYKCLCCGKVFTATYNWRGYRSGGWADSSLFCPGCGKKLSNLWRGHNDIFYSPKAFSGASEAMPVGAGLRLHEIKNGYRLDISVDSITLLDSMRADRRWLRESITFDVKNRKTLCKGHIVDGDIATGLSGVKGVLELGNPFDRRFQASSLLRFINLDIMRNKERAQQIRGIMKKLRDGIRSKFKRFHGYDIGSLYISSGKMLDGKLLASVSYIATRLILPDLKHMEKALFHCSNFELTQMANRSGLGGELPGDIHHNGLFHNMDALRKAPDSVSGLLAAAAIPDKPLFRKSVMDKPHYAKMLGVLARWFAPDMAVKLLNHFTDGGFDYGCQYNAPASLAGLLEAWVKEHELKDIYKTLLGTHYISHLFDIDRMQKQLDKVNTEKFKTVKLYEAHDWLVEAVREQQERDYDLNIPEHIRRRLEMQEGQIKFFMPDTHWKLRDFGKKFHNCVGTYAERVLSGKCGIVIMTDDKGMLAACLEVRDNALVQAKLKYNDPVHENQAINDEILKWCRAAGLEIITKDVQKTRRKPLEARTA